ncbi:hypothetical protein AB0I22_19585 [Streptomyces sp. NPDC050610]|uniref:calcium-binding protein n=1 Tax=Streptomyces sp. NPDC050610 TaxID=3157097 RepID=UPI003414819F
MSDTTVRPNRLRSPRSRALRRVLALFGGLLLALSGLVGLAPGATARPSAVELTLSGPTDSADPVQAGTSYTYDYTLSADNDVFFVETSLTLSGASATITAATSDMGPCTFTATTASCTGDIFLPDSRSVAVTVTPNTAGTVTADVFATGSDTNDVNGSQSTTIESSGPACTITGTSGDDTLNGTNGDDVICGLGGNDTITAGNGNDTVSPGPGNDTASGGNGNDTLIDHAGTDALSGNNGDDSIDVQDTIAGDTADGGNGVDTCTTDPGDTTISC